MASRGWVHVICGPMFSGKTERLLRLINRAEIAGKVVVLVKPGIDTRTTEVASRNGLSHQGIVIADNSSKAVLAIYNKYVPDILAIDEAQFFDHELSAIVSVIARRGATVLVSGLDKDFRSLGFGPMGDLLVVADEVTKLTAICFVCKKKASLTQRLVNGKPAKFNDPLVVVGGINDDVYEARCRKDWELG